MARVISHRGQWAAVAEKNTRAAFARSFTAGYGTETDVRDLGGRLVISHDPPRCDHDLGLDEVLRMFIAAGQPGVLALNVKADGLQAAIAEAIARSGVRSWFAFDMSVPDTLSYRRAGLPYYARLSEHEPVAAMLDGAAGVWLDAFEGDWYDEALVASHVADGREVCLVSPELHGREPGPSWERWAGWAAMGAGGVTVCTDRPDELAAVLGA